MTISGRIRKVFELLTPSERKRAGLVGLLVAVSALVETAGVASVLPFLSVLGRPEGIDSNPQLRWVYDSLGFESPGRFLLFLGVASLVMVVGSGAVRLATEYVMVRFAEMRRHSLSCRLLRGYLRQPYPFFLNRNSADLSKGILSEVDSVVQDVIYPATYIPAFGLVAIGLVSLLVFVDPTAAGVATLLIGGVYALTYLGIGRITRRRGQDRVRANRERFTNASEALGGIKDLKVLGREGAYLKRFKDPSLRYSRHRAFVRVLSTIPRYVIESLGFGGILVYALALMAAGNDLGRVLPVLGLYAFAGYRLLPAVQNLYSNFTKLRFGLPAVEALYEDLTMVAAASSESATTNRITLDTGIRWSGVSYRYPGSDIDVLQDVDLEILPGTVVGFVGPTGAGKSTAVDLILGLLRPSKGEVLVNDCSLSEVDLRSWQNSIGYVPQQVYLADDTVAANIAFGVPHDVIDRDAVERAAQLASLHEFITTELPQGYDSIVGERGVRISGGQRQRLGIARALYTDPLILVFDEATSSLDSITEHAVMDAVYKLDDRKTVILIAHRLSTVENADQIFLLDQGRLVDVGSFEEIVQRNDQVRQMVASIAGGAV